ncbi:MAG: TonB-dependent receptor [Verrucomicrobiota bacterium JB022]|nr:TonB-dependent receptor [Verrucomicrobiota bacterium JB022]
MSERTTPDEAALSDPAADVQNLPVESDASGSANESPRERGRVLQKRNPIASEYQAFGDVGLGSAADGDGEGVDYRAFFPGSTILGRKDSLRTGLELNYNHMSGSSAWGGGVQGLVGWGEDKWAFAFQARSSAADRAVEHYEAYWATLRGGYDGDDATTDDEAYFLDRPRYSRDTIYTRDNRYTGQLEWAPSENQLFYLRAFYQDYYDRFYRNRLELQFGAGDFDVLASEGDTVTQGQVEDGRTRRYFGDTITNRERYRLTAGGETRFDWGAISYSAFYHKWDMSDMWWDWNFKDSGLDMRYDISDPAFPTYEILSGQDLMDTSTAEFQSLRLHPTETTDEDYAGRADVEYRLETFDQPIWIYSGVLHREKKRTNREDREVYNPANGGFTLDRVDQAYAPGTIVRDRFEQPAGLAATPGAHFFYDNKDAYFGFEENASKLESYQQTYDAEEAVSGGYLLLASALGKWNVSAGLRAEHTKTDTLGIEQVPVSVNDPSVGREIDQVGDVVVKERTANRSYWNYLPSFQLEYKLAEDWTLRGAWSQVLMRPQYFDIVQYRRVAIPTQTISEGNPNLEPTRINQYQFGIVHGTESWGTLSVELYYLEISNFFYGAADTEYIGGAPYTVSRVENGEEGHIQGFTAQWDKRFKLTETWALATSLGYTYSDHEAKIDTPTRPDETIAVPGRSDHLAQARVDLNDDRYRFSLGFSYQSESLDDVDQSAGRDTYREKVISFDAAASRAIGEHWRVGVQVFNLLDSPERSYMGDELRQTKNQYSLWYGVVSADYTF